LLFGLPLCPWLFSAPPFLSHVASIAPSLLHAYASQPLPGTTLQSGLPQLHVQKSLPQSFLFREKTTYKFCHLCQFTWLILQHPKEFFQVDLELEDLLISWLIALFKLLIGCVQSLAIAVGF